MKWWDRFYRWAFPPEKELMLPPLEEKEEGPISSLQLSRSVRPPRVKQWDELLRAHYDLYKPYEPQLVYYMDADRFEFVESDVAVVMEEVIPGIFYLYPMDSYQHGTSPIGFSIDGELIRKKFQEKFK